jgi:hypothetical protein
MLLMQDSLLTAVDDSQYFRIETQGALTCPFGVQMADFIGGLIRQSIIADDDSNMTWRLLERAQSMCYIASYHVVAGIARFAKTCNVKAWNQKHLVRLQEFMTSFTVPQYAL